jgi:hypothetical protein
MATGKPKSTAKTTGQEKEQQARRVDRITYGEVAKDLRDYRRYAIVSDADLKAAALRLDGYNFGDTRGLAVDAAAVRV